MTPCPFCPSGRPPTASGPTCATCYGEIAVALDTLPGLLAGLASITGRTLARPARDIPAAPGGSGPSSPANETLIDLREELRATVTEWATAVDATATTPPTRTLGRHLAVALSMGGGTEWAGRLLHLTELARRRLEPPTVVQVRDRCPSCGTRGLIRYDSGGPCWCVYCYAESYPAA